VLDEKARCCCGASTFREFGREAWMHLLLKYKSGLRGNAGTASTKKEKAEKNPFPYFTTTTDFQVEPCTSTQLPPLRTKWLHRVLLILKSVLKAQLESIEHKNGFWLPGYNCANSLRRLAASLESGRNISLSLLPPKKFEVSEHSEPLDS
jgi:hypothetical protein